VRSRVLVLVAVTALAACGDDGGGGGAPEAGCRAAEDGAVTVAAAGIAWDVDCLEARADEALTITVDNQDDGVQHNLHLTDAPGDPATELEPGPVTQELDVTLPAGDYEFVCDIHPNMVGTLRVADANPAAP
jgi:hypothetical protein